MIRKLLALLALAALAALPACTGLDSDSDELPSPAIFAATPAAACGTPGAASIVLDPIGVHVTENGPIEVPSGPGRVDVSGVVTGLPAGQSIYGVVVDDDLDCPLTSWSEITAVAADGSFTMTLGITTPTGRLVERFRVLALAGPAGATAACGASGDCVELQAGGASTPASGISNAIGVRLL